MGIREIALIVATLLALAGVYTCDQPEFMKQRKREIAERDRLERVPHVIREADGCKVYAFKADDRIHYFTRCADSKTTTESGYTVNCGKNCTRTETESIQTAQ